LTLVQDDQKAAMLVQGALGVVLCPPFVGVVVRDGDREVGAVVFNDYTGANVEMTGVGRGCWTPTVIRELARYCFATLGVRRVTARTAVSNAKAIRSLERMGFRREGIAREWFDGEDAILFGLLAREQRIVR
jgi:hypothetical protein